jgi:RNA polymerase sigma-70 factor (ECF subfamily)
VVRKKIEEDELIILLKKKDKEAFTYLYDHYSTALYGIIFKIVNNEEIAQDILQEVFIKIWKNLENYDPAKGRLFTWLLNLTRNYAIDQYRSREFRQQNKNQNLEDSVHAVDTLMQSVTKMDHIGLKETVSKLKPEYIQVIDLLYFKGYTHEEVAREFNIPLGTVKTRIRSAIIQLRERLAIV